MQEKWKWIKGYAKLYQISNLGRVRSYHPRFRKPRILMPGIATGGYPIVSLVRNKRKVNFLVHKLVLIAFKGRAPNLKEVNHKDGNKRNNALTNLEYVTKSENVLHAIRSGLLKPNTKKIAQEKRKTVAQIDVESHQIIQIFVSAHEASRITHINRGNISTGCRNYPKIISGYYWKYLCKK